MTGPFIVLAIVAALLGVAGVALLLQGFTALGILALGGALILGLGVHRVPGPDVPPEQRP